MLDFLEARFPFGRNSQAWWSAEPTTSLIIFVHGFGGSAVGTWRDFPGSLRSQLRGSDLVFYGYDGEHARAGISAGLLKKHMNVFLDHPDKVFNESMLMMVQRDAFQYETITVVAHSLGAIVSRLALVEAFNEKQPWVNAIRLILFAPAHRG